MVDQSHFMAITELGVAGSTRRMVPFLRAIRVPPLCLQPLLFIASTSPRSGTRINIGCTQHSCLERCNPSDSPDLAYAEFSGPVVSVLDGDTIEVLHNPAPCVSASTASTALQGVIIGGLEDE